ncbi:MAG: family 78 glycoside hydrolase catalytic domain [Phycisphaeraceae bacterium]
MSHSIVDVASAPSNLHCEYHPNPLGVEEKSPRLSWLFQDPGTLRGARQGAYQVLAASSREKLAADEGDLWDSGKIASDQSTHVEYAGAPLKAQQRCWWKVRTWNGRDESSSWSAPAWWEMGLCSPRAWKGAWIMGPARPADAPAGGVPCPHFRKTFTLDSPPDRVQRARVYVTARGLYELYLNGQRVGDDVFAAGWHDYHRRLPYRVYDVTGLLCQGQNVLAAILADGWYCGHVAWREKLYGAEPSLLLQMHVTDAQGKRQVIISDSTWRCTTGPILEADFLMGETYDCRQELPRWNEPGYDDGAWQAARSSALSTDDAKRLAWHPGPPVRRIQEIKPIAISEPAAPGSAFIFDLGQNMVGWVRLRVPAGLPAGTRLTLRHAEMLQADGTLYTENLRSAKATDHVITAGSDAFDYEPRFTFHGFRYVELSGLPASSGKPNAETVTGIVVHSHLAPTGQFACSHPLVNQLQRNIQWGQKGNFLEVPTDCPQRNERLGWTGDAQIFVRTACFNMDVAAFFSKWTTDLRDAQDAAGGYPAVVPDILRGDHSDGGPGWADAGVIVPWTIYRCYGDQRILRRHYQSMARYIQYLGAVDVDKRHNYGDWLNIMAHTPVDLVHYAYAAHSTDLMSRIAGVLGKPRDARKYAGALTRIKKAFAKRYITAEGRVLGDTQTAYILALQFDLVPERMRRAAQHHLAHDIVHGRYGDTYQHRNTHISTGFLGTRDINSVLTDAGRLDLAYQLLLRDDFPSWLMPVKNGATTIWERWNSWTPDRGFGPVGMNSFNHYAYGAIGQWLYQVVAGLDLAPQDDAAGYRRLLIHPRPQPGADAAIHHANAAYDSIHGRIEISWSIVEGRFTLTVTLPPNTRATVRFAAPSLDAVSEGDQPAVRADGVSNAKHQGGDFIAEIGSGRYSFAVPWA